MIKEIKNLQTQQLIGRVNKQMLVNELHAIETRLSSLMKELRCHKQEFICLMKEATSIEYLLSDCVMSLENSEFEDIQYRNLKDET